MPASTLVSSLLEFFFLFANYDPFCVPGYLAFQLNAALLIKLNLLSFHMQSMLTFKFVVTSF